MYSKHSVKYLSLELTEFSVSQQPAFDSSGHKTARDRFETFHSSLQDKHFDFRPKRFPNGPEGNIHKSKSILEES